MRLHKRSLKTVYTFEKKEVESDYVGTETKYVESRAVKCNVQPAENKVTAEIYGEKVSSMFSLLFDINDSIGDAVSFEKSAFPTHKVVSVYEYSQHKKAIVEVIA